jgi:hypothetical protein
VPAISALAAGPRRPKHCLRRQTAYEDCSRPLPLLTRISCATPDLLLKHLNATLITYKKKTDETFKHASKTLAKIPEKHLKTIANMRNI